MPNAIAFSYAALAVVLSTMLVSAAYAQESVEFSTELTPDAVGPTTADPEGSGTAQLTAYVQRGELCYQVVVEDIAPAYAAHVHLGQPGRIGPVQFVLDPPANGSSTGCVSADRNMLRAMIENPVAYYVDVHNAEYPGPTLRGQLGSTVTE